MLWKNTCKKETNMGALEKHQRAKQQNLDSLNTALTQIQQQLLDLQQEIRIQGQLAKAQESLAKEFDKAKEGFKRLLRDSCACFDKSALDDMLEDLTTIVEETKADYDRFSESDRFVNMDTANEQDETPQLQSAGFHILADASPSISKDIPSEDDDTIPLSEKNIETVLIVQPDEVLTKLKPIFGIDGRTKSIDKIASAIAIQKITHYRLRELISLLSSMAEVTNGSKPT